MQKFDDYGEDELSAAITSMQRLVALFKQEFDLDIYLTWGTLLGAIREGDFIAFDNDIDIAYLSSHKTDFEITEEHEFIVRVLRQSGYPVLRNSKGQIHVRVTPDTGAGGAIYNLDLWTTWVRGGKYFHYPDIKGELAEADILPLKPHLLRGAEFLVPAKPESILTTFYGPDWQKPDPNYAWYPRYHADDAFEFLRSAPAAVGIPSLPLRNAELDVVEDSSGFFVSGPQVEPQRLNSTAMLILELCNGRNEVAEIVNLLQSAFDLPSAPEVVVLEFLSNAVATGLVIAPRDNGTPS